MKHICVAIDNDTSAECLYINGKAWGSLGEWTVYATDIAEAAGNDPIRFEHRCVNCPTVPSEAYPDKLEMKWPTLLAQLERAE